MNYCGYEFGEKTVELALRAEEDCAEMFRRTDEICLKRSAEVLRAFQKERVSTSDFIEITGYGYYDGGRDKLERIYSDIFGTEDALVRIQFMSGTHALYIATSGLLEYGDTMLCI